jgi:hypothetical protein
MTLAVRKPRKLTSGWNGFLISIEIDPTCEILIAWIAIQRKNQRLNREAESSDGSDRGGLPCHINRRWMPAPIGVRRRRCWWPRP